MAIEYLKRASKTPETETGTAREVVTAMLGEIERRGEEAVRDYALKLDKWDGPILVTREEMERRAREVPDQVRRDIAFAADQVRPLRRCPAREREGLLGGTSARPHRGAEAGALQCRRLLRAHRALCPHRVRLHVGRHGEGGGRRHRGRLLHALPGRRHPPLCALCHDGGRRGCGDDARRGAGHRRHGLRPVHRQAGGHHRRPRQQVRRRGEAHAVRQGGYRRVRRPLRGGGDRRRDRRSADGGGGPRGPGRARPRESRMALHLVPRAGG